MVTITQFQCGSFPGRHYFRQAIRISHVLSIAKAYLLGLQSRVCVAQGGRLGCTSRGSPPSARYHYYGTVLTTSPHWYFYDGASTITILIATYDAGTMHASIIASDTVMECKASDYAESHSSK